MKKNLLFLFVALAGLFSFASCSDDDDDKGLSSVPAKVEQALSDRFPDAKNVKWEKKGAYIVADFYELRLDKEAWFTHAGEWKMTETDYGKDLFYLPADVEGAFAAGEYGTWTVDDVTYYERPDKNFYLIEVEKPGHRDMDLYYNADGTMIKAVADNDADITPDTVI